MNIAYAPQFLRLYKKLTLPEQDRVKESIERFKKNPRDSKLETHKLKGKLMGRYSFSWGFRDRIVFRPLSKTEVLLLSVGDHEVYQ